MHFAKQMLFEKHFILFCLAPYKPKKKKKKNQNIFTDVLFPFVLHLTKVFFPKTYLQIYVLFSFVMRFAKQMLFEKHFILFCLAPYKPKKKKKKIKTYLQMFYFLLFCTSQKFFFFPKHIYKYMLYFVILKENKNWYITLNQGSPDSVLEGQCPAEFSSNLPQHTCLEVSNIPRKTWWAASGVFN